MIVDENGKVDVDMKDFVILFSGKYFIIGRIMVVSFFIIRICVKFFLSYSYRFFYDY